MLQSRAEAIAAMQAAKCVSTNDPHLNGNEKATAEGDQPNHLLEAQIHVVLIRSEMTEEGESVRRFHDLELVRDRNPLFALSWTVIHPITERSPLFGMTADSLSARQALIVVSLTGLDETLLQTVPARRTYGPSDIILGARLADILRPADNGSSWMIDSAQFDETVDAPLTLASPARAK
jgi:inward rectifier potassium channel